MKCVVELYVAGTRFKEEVIAKNFDHARKTAIARNPSARVISVNLKF